MRHVSFYHPDTGLFHGTQLTTTDEEAIALNTPEGYLVIDGHHDALSKKVDRQTGAVVDHQPAQPSPDHIWDAESRRWVLSPDVLAAQQARAAALSAIQTLDAKSIRVLRELALGVAGAADRLAMIEAAIADQRCKL